MTDLTPLFNQCVAIVQDELKPSPRPASYPDFLLTDTFHKECRELYLHNQELNSFLHKIKQPYLAIDDNGLSVDDKNQLDEDFQIKLQALYEKLKMLQAYENKRQAIPKKNWVSSLFGDDEKEVYFVTVSQHRTQVLKFLSDCLNGTSKRWRGMAGQRQVREKQMSLLNFQNLEEEFTEGPFIEGHRPEMEGAVQGMDLQGQNMDLALDLGMDLGLNGTSTGMDLSLNGSDPSAPGGTEGVLVQELESENQAFLTQKTNQLKQVEKLHTSMVDIINIQTEITYQIENQSHQIMNLIDNQDQINLDLSAGNKKLTSATGKNKRSANIIIVTSVVLGLMILFMDYVN